ncbi:hypothetical protein ABW19_dt0202427 [Dactylella cylindrospora]|nr:hypothetical protein ABW19_dt0202427 [Dactylella cylindrospora]
MKFLVPLALLLAAVSAAPVEVDAEAVPVSDVSVGKRQTCFNYWAYVECSSNGPTGHTGQTSANVSGGGSPSWCTSWCQTNRPGSNWAGITNGNICICGTGNANSMPQSAAGSCYSTCQYSSKVCTDGSCHCGGPRAYSIFQYTLYCY